MGLLKRSLFGMVKSAVLVIVTAVQFMTSWGIIQRQNSPFLLSLISCLRSDVEILMHVEAVEATGLKTLLLQILQVTKCNKNRTLEHVKSAATAIRVAWVVLSATN
jgi:hypothetical protein